MRKRDGYGETSAESSGDYLDGRKFCPILYQLFAEKCSVRSVDELDTYINQNFSDKPKIADFAGLAEEAYQQGDKESERILHDCVQVLFEPVRDTVKKVEKSGEEPETLFLWGGVVTKNQFVVEELKSLVKAEYPQIEIVCPQMEVTEIAVQRATHI